MSVKVKEVQVDLGNGVTVIAEVTSTAEIKELVAGLQGLGLLKFASAENDVQRQIREKHRHTDGETTSPESLVETRAGLPTGSLRTANVLGFKDDVPQLLRPNTFASVSDAALALLFAVEAGLKKNSLEFEAFKALYESQNVKSGSPVSMMLSNLKNSGYLDGKLYSGERKVRLTAKGEGKAIDVLKALVGKGKG